MRINFEDGYILSIDKPYTWTSADVVRKVKNLLMYKNGLKKIKVGHAGTLDPLATGLLIVCIGKATKQAEQIQAGEKEYIADICFGATTPSFDLESEVDARYPYEHITPERIEALFPTFLGDIDQIPPVFSAKLIDGKRAYEYARSGQEVEMRSAKVSIYELSLISYEAPVAKIRIRCSKGTYIRSLARDFGLEAGSGAYLAGLRRTASGTYSVEKALSMTEAEAFFSLQGEAGGE